MNYYKLVIGIILYIGVFLQMERGICADLSPFTVDHAVSRVKLYDTALHSGDLDPVPFYASPTGSKLFIITGKGDLHRKNYNFQILMYDSGAIANYISGLNKSPPAAKILVQWKYDQSAKALSVTESGGLKRLYLSKDENYLYFLAPDSGSIFQIYKVNLSTGGIEKVTNSKTHIVDYAFDEEEKYIIYHAYGFKNKNNDCDKLSFRAGVRLRYELSCLKNGKSILEDHYGNEPTYQNSSLYLASAQHRTDEILLYSNFSSNNVLSTLMFSPDGKHAVIRLQTSHPPSNWPYNISDAAAIDAARSFITKIFDKNTAASDDSFFYYGVISFADKNMRLLEQIPIRLIEEWRNIRWLDDNNVVLPAVNTAIIIKDSNRIIESGGISRYINENIVYNLSNNSYEFPLEEKMRFTHGSIRAHEKGTATSENEIKKYNARGGRCFTGSTGENLAKDGLPACYVDIHNKTIRITTEESYNEPPNIYATDIKNGQKRLLLKLNPQFDYLQFGKVELLEWTDEGGRAWTAGLVLPTNYAPNRRFPLVIQTHGFSRHAFLIDGPAFYTAPYAAQALANRGIAVLQFPNFASRGVQEDHPVLARGINSAVRLLNMKGIIDPEKVGLLGYSARGSLVLRMTVFPEFVPAATLAADAFDPTIFGWATFFGLEGWGVMNHELLYCGAQPWGESQAEWIRQDPFFHLDKIRSPLLIAKYNHVDPTWWGVYVGLRRLKRPVDYISFDDGKHPPLAIDVIRQAQTLTVDWFDYWLNGLEETGPDKAEQYKIWRRLRQERDNIPLIKHATAPLSNMDCPNLEALPTIR